MCAAVNAVETDCASNRGHFNSGCTAIVVTVDTPFLGRREEDIRNQFHLPEGLSLRNFEDVFAERMTQVAINCLRGGVYARMCGCMAWTNALSLVTVVTLTSNTHPLPPSPHTHSFLRVNVRSRAPAVSTSTWRSNLIPL